MKSRWRQETWTFTAKRYWNAFLNVFYMDDNASLCLLCQRPLHNAGITANPHKSNQIVQADDIPGVCLFCLQDVKLLAEEPRSRILRVRTRAGVEVRIPVISAQRYEGVIRNAIRQWKYDGAIPLTSWFASMAVSAYAGLREDREPDSPSPSVVVPVPTTRDRLRKRGYHHVGLLAAHTADLLSLPMESALEREQDGKGSFTQSQTAKDARERLRGLQGKFRVAPGTSVAAEHVLLVDDIVTTGATLYTCAATLMEAGAKQVTALVIADVV